MVIEQIEHSFFEEFGWPVDKFDEIGHI